MRLSKLRQMMAQLNYQALLLTEPRPRCIDGGGGTSNTPKYTCDGRTHCSQMTSCEEAKFFLRNCPNTKMDGDNDGIPCEQQWCTGLFGG